MKRAKGEICSKILENQKKIASSECDISKLTQVNDIPVFSTCCYLSDQVVHNVTTNGTNAWVEIWKIRICCFDLISKLNLRVELIWGCENLTNIYGAIELVMNALELISCFDMCLSSNEEIKEKKRDGKGKKILIACAVLLMLFMTLYQQTLELIQQERVGLSAKLSEKR